MNNDPMYSGTLSDLTLPTDSSHPQATDTMGAGASIPALRPHTLEDSGLSEIYVGDLISKHLFERGVLDLQQLTRYTALPGSQVERVFCFLRNEGRAEIRGQAANGMLRFALTDRGRAAAQEALQRDGYIGPAPVPLDQYCKLVARQSMRARGLGCEEVRTAFRDITIRPEILDQLGPAMQSGRAIFIHGDSGTGKTYIARKLSRLMLGEVLIPHAVLVADKAVRLYDPEIHQRLDRGKAESSLFLDRGHDPRYELCKRPVVMVGGELTMDMLEVKFDPATRIHHAPAQMQANNGMLVIDDLGRQRMRPDELFNRWIVPMEDGLDYLTLATGQHFEVPFNVALLFSSNLHPLDLADEAFLRRIGYKIRFHPLTREEYRDIWSQECQRQGVAEDPELASFMLDQLHGTHGVPLLPCHPRDFIGLAMDCLRYRGQSELTQEALRWAWQNYFVEPGNAGEESES